jgi:hypothetical protein
VLDQLIVVDYQEGAGGEFIASWLSAHYGHKLETDSQANPNYLQKWLNSYSLVYADWDENFANYLQIFLKECNSQGVSQLAVPYHLYKYPQHVEILGQYCATRFVRINCDGYQKQVFDDFKRKVLNRVLQARDFNEIKFLLQGQSKQRIAYCMQLFKKNQLTYQTLLCTEPLDEPKTLPSNDIEILYKEFFVDFANTDLAYQKLCEQLQLHADAKLLDALIERNKKNLQQQQAI